MSSIIPFLIIAAIGFVFDMAKKKGEQPAKPVEKASPAPAKKAPHQPTLTKAERKPVQSFEDFAKQIFEGLEESQEPEKPLTRPAPPKVEPVIVKEVPTVAPQKQERASMEERLTQMREQAMEDRSITLKVERKVPTKSKKHTSHIPTTADGLMQAVVMAEILGPPKAKQVRKI